MSYVIEEGIPMPECPSKGNGGAHRGPKKPWGMALDSLQPGQSTLTTEWSDVRAAEQFRLYRPERRYAVRKIAGQGWRVWRTE